MRRFRTLVYAAAVAALAPLAAAAHANQPEPSYLTVMLGRGLAGLCFDDPRVVTVNELARELAARNVAATPLAVINNTGETNRSCIGGRRYASWADYRWLHQRFGWDVASEGFDHRALADVTATSSLAERQAAWDDTCGSLAAFQQHGVDARGAYAYAGGPTSNYVQQAFVSQCFSWGRHYGSGTSSRTKLAPQWYESTRSVGGGRCNDPSLPCYDSPPTNKPYFLPSKLITLFHPKPGHWASVQIYNLVRGSRIGERPAQFSWDCSSPNPSSHWTSRAELYCADDFFAALDQRSSTAIATTPLGVARAWGRADLAGTPRPTS